MDICSDNIIVLTSVFMLLGSLEKYLEIGIFLDFCDFSVKMTQLYTHLKFMNLWKFYWKFKSLFMNFMLILNRKSIVNI